MAEDDKELFESAFQDEVAEVETPEPETPQETARDERGRFKAKEEAPEPVLEPEVKPEPKTEGIPSWRLKEEAEARRAAEERANRYERDLDEMRRQIAAQNKPKAEPEKLPEIWEDPNAFVDHGVRQAIDPIKSEIGQLREFYSRREAIREHGAEKVDAAYKAIEAGLKSGDPEAHAVYQRAMKSFDPYGDIVGWHQKSTVFSQIGSDPNAWLEKQLEERLKDPAYQAQLLERIRGTAQESRPVTQLPPSLNKATRAAASVEDDDSEAGLLKSALRR